jgi:hypothetical protein
MTRLIRSWLPILVLATAAVLAPATARASSAPSASAPASPPAAPCAGPLSANTEITNVSAIAPTKVDVLANDCVGLATASRPVTITKVGQGASGSVTTDGATITYDPRACATGDADGNDVVPYTISDGSITKAGIAVVHILRPASSPLTDAPQAGFVTNSTIGSTVPVRVAWCGVAASGSSVKSYRIEQGTNGGSTFPTVVTASTTGTSTTRNATPGTAYAWRARTTDSRNRAGAFAPSLTSKVAVIQDTSSAIHYSTGWSTATATRYSGHKEHATTRAGATATLTVTNVRAIAIVASKAARRGTFHVYVDAVRVTTTAISEKASTAAWRRVLFVRGLTSGAGVSHTVTIRASGNGRVDLDAILTLSGKRDQALTFTAAPAARYHGPTYAVAATASSGLPVSLSINQGSWAVCSLAGGVVSFLQPGSCRIDASQSGDPTWNARSGSQTFAVARIPLTVTGITAPDRPYDGTTAATLDTTAALLDSSGVVSGDVVALDVSGASGSFGDGEAGAGKTVQVAGLALTGAAAGRYSVTQPSAQASITGLGLALTFTAEDRPYDGSTTASIVACSVATVLGGDDVTCDPSGASAAFADPGAAAGKTVTGSGFVLAGGDAANYAIDTVDTTTAEITKAVQSISFTSSAPTSAAVGDTYVPAATASSGLDVTLSIDPGAASVCHLTAGQVTMDDAGACIVAANQGGDANHEAAPEVTQPFAVGSGPLGQTISFDLSGVTATYGDDPVAISATASSALDVTFASQTTAVCAVAGSDVTILAAGTCTIRASQAGDGAYAPAPDVDRSFNVAQRAITVTAVTDTRPADGTTASGGVPTITSGTLVIGDTATWTQAFDTATVGTNKTLAPSGTVSQGSVDVTSSYAITFIADTTGVILPGAADVTTSTVTAAPHHVKNDGVDTLTVTVQLRDAFGNALIASGGTVVAFADHGSVGIVTDNADGTYTATYTSDTFSGQVTFSAELDGTPLTESDSVNQS